MKKILSITVSLILLMSCIFTNFTVSADGGVVLSVTSQSATKGSTVSISVNVTQNNGFSFLMITPNYDSDNLTLTNTENGNVCNSMTNGKNPNWNGNGENITATGTLVTFTFKITKVIYPSLVTNMQLYFFITLSIKEYAFIGIVILGSYLVSNYLLKKHINSISLAEALKNRD